MKRLALSYFLTMFLHLFFLFSVGIMFLFIYFFTEGLKRMSNTGSVFWSFDFPSVLLGIEISIFAAYLYTKKWIPWVKKKTGIKLSLE